MKILRINSIVSFRGGAEAYINNINEMLERQGHQILTITLNSGESGVNSEKYVEVKMSGNPISRMFKDIVPQDDILKLLNMNYKEFKPDIIHLHHIRLAFSSVEKFLKSVDTPVVFTAHDALLVCPLSTLVQPGNKICDGGTGLRCGFTGCKIHGHLTYELLLSNSIKRIRKSKIVAYLCPSYSVLNYLHNNGFGPVVHLPSFSKFNKGAIETDPDYEQILNQKSIGYIGRLESYKGVHDLIKAFKIVVERHHEMKLKIAGIGGYETKLKQLSDELGIADKVEWLGKIGPAAREEFYSSVFSIVVPSNYWENFALVAQEALLRGIPTVATEIGGIPEIVKDGVTGRIVPISSPTKIAEAIEEIQLNRNNTLKIMRQGRKHIMDNISPEKHLDGLLKVYDKLTRNEKITDMAEAGNLT